MDQIIQSILDHSKIEVQELDVSEPQNNTIRISLKARITGLGPIHAVVEAMAVKLRGPAGVFAELRLPEIMVDPTGGDIIVQHQEIGILDLAAFEAFVKTAVLANSVTLDIVDGKGIMTALGMTTPTNFQKNMTLRGMEHIQIDILSMTKVDDGQVDYSAGVPIEATIRLNNPSPFQIEVGRVLWALTSNHKGNATPAKRIDVAAAIPGTKQTALQTAQGVGRKLFAQFTGNEPLTILRNETIFTIKGNVQPSLDEDDLKYMVEIAGIPNAESSGNKAKSQPYYPCQLKGVSVEPFKNNRTGQMEEAAGWMDRIAQTIDLPVGVPINPELAGLFIIASSRFSR